MRTVTPKGSKTIPPQAKQVFKGVIFDVYQWPQKMFDGSIATFEMLKRPDTVKILAIKDNKIVMLDEQQPDHNRAYELPGGRHDVEPETELDCAKREMLEETGMSFKNWRLIAAEEPLTKIDWFIYTFLAFDFEKQIEPHLDAGEKIDVQFVNYEKLLELSKGKSGKYLPTELLERAGSIEGLIALPEYSDQ